MTSPNSPGRRLSPSVLLCLLALCLVWGPSATGMAGHQYDGTDPLTVTSLTSDPSSPVSVDTPVTWSATAGGGLAPYTYKFLVYDGASWSIGRDWGPESSWTWLPPSSGTYTFQVWVRNAGSSAFYDTFSADIHYIVTEPQPLAVSSLTANSASPSPAGAPVTWTATASGGSWPYTYKFFVYDGSAWSVGRDWSSANTWTWTPSSPGSYTFQVWAKNAGSTAFYDAWSQAGPYSATEPRPTVTALVADRLSPVLAETPVTWAATASGGIGPLTYKFFVYDGASWSVGQEWSAANTWTWTPPKVGNYNVQVWVRNAGSVATYDAWLGAGPYVVTWPPPLASSITIGGTGIDTVGDIAVDDEGNAYVVGVTTSTDFPVSSGAFQPTKRGTSDGFVVKVRRDGTIAFATYFGGSGSDGIAKVSVDAAGAVYLAVSTTSSDYPGAAATCAPCLFVSKLSPDGGSLMYSTRVAESDRDAVGFTDLAVTANGTVYYVYVSSNFTCVGWSLKELTPAGAHALNQKPILSRGDCEFGINSPLGPIAAASGDDGFASYSYTYSSGPATVLRFRADGTRVFATDLDPLLHWNSLSVDPDGGALIGTTLGKILSIDPNGALLSTRTIETPAEWVDRPAVRKLGKDWHGDTRAVICGALPGSGQTECRYIAVEDTGAVTSSFVVDTQPATVPQGRAAYAITRTGDLYTAKGSDDITIRRYNGSTSFLDFSHAAEVRFGTSVTLIAATFGTNLEFKFVRRDPFATWMIVQDWSSHQTYTWTPAYTDRGVHDVQVWIRAIGSKNPYDNWRGTQVTVVDGPLPAITAFGSPPGPFRGSPNTWTAQATGGVAPVYEFIRLDPDGWRVVQPYSAKKTYTWTPVAADEGPHELQVWVRNADSEASYEAWSGLNFTVESPAPLTVSLAALDPIPAEGTGTVRWRATASGGIVPYEYRFARLDADGWHVAQDYSASDTYTWSPGVNDTGTHVLQVWVRNAGSTAAFEAWAGSGEFEVPPPPPISVSLFPLTGPFTAGTQLHTQASLTISPNKLPVLFQFVRWDESGGWQIVQPYSTNRDYYWQTTAADVGSHVLQVWIRRERSTADYEAWATTGLFTIHP
jgi:hypothetical protein